jgi:hypothetical protein
LKSRTEGSIGWEEQIVKNQSRRFLAILAILAIQQTATTARFRGA